MRFTNRNLIIVIVGVLILSIAGVLPLFASAPAGTAKTLELTTNANVDNFVSNDSAADDDVLVSVHDQAKIGAGPLVVTIEGNDDEIAMIVTEIGSTGEFTGTFQVVDVIGDITTADTTETIVGTPTSATTTLTVTAYTPGTEISTGDRLLINSLEEVLVTDAASTTTIVVVRGVGGTTAVAYTGGETLFVFDGGLNFVFEEDNGDDITVKYEVSFGISVSKVTKVDSAGPSISEIFPDDDSFLKSSTIIFTAEITDAGVSMGDDADVTANTTFTIGSTVLNPASVTEQATDDVWDVNVSLSLNEALYTWTIVATDLVGNTTTKPSSGTFALTVDRTAPQIVKAFTGFAWNSDDKDIDINERDSIVVFFRKTGTSDVPDFLAAGTLTASDFVVAGNTITGLVFPDLDAVDGGADLSNMAAEIADAMDSSVDADGTDDETRYMVFISLEDDLASDAEPTVQIFAGGVEDLAGNDNSSQDLTADDKIGPGFTVTITGETSSRPVVRGKVDREFTVRIGADEPLNNNNPPTVYMVTLDDISDVDVAKSQIEVDLVDTPLAGELDLVATNTWEATRDGDDPTWGSNFSGLVVVFVVGEDENGNTATTKGIKAGGDNTPQANEIVDLSDAAKAGLLIEWDTDLNMAGTKFELRPESGTGETESTNPFIVINFSEKAEYKIIPADTGEDADPQVLVPDGTINAFDDAVDKFDDTTIDSHNKVTLTSLTLDGVDVLGQIGTIDDDSFVVALSGLAVGEYTLLCTAVDEVGNKVDDDTCDFDFEVVERGDYEVPLNPGWNLVSLPGTPADPAIDSVLPSSMSASRVLQWVGGAFEVAERGDDG
ncbi:MAG: hypothetical protein IIA44_07695, partial [Acidobacteria bacterium]|nr:hypothetical protein [Acidobacteriota bacterium]